MLRDIILATSVIFELNCTCLIWYEDYAQSISCIYSIHREMANRKESIFSLKFYITVLLVTGRCCYKKWCWNVKILAHGSRSSFPSIGRLKKNLFFPSCYLKIWLRTFLPVWMWKRLCVVGGESLFEKFRWIWSYYYFTNFQKPLQQRFFAIFQWFVLIF